MDLHYVAPGLMQPRDHNDVVSRHQPVEGRSRECADFEPRVRRAFRALFGCSLQRLNLRSDCADGMETRHDRAPYRKTLLHGHLAFRSCGKRDFVDAARPPTWLNSLGFRTPVNPSTVRFWTLRFAYGQ